MKILTDRKVQPEKVASGDYSRPAMAEPWLDVEKGQLNATDSYKLVTIPVAVADDDTTGPISADALKLLRKQRIPSEIRANGGLRVAPQDVAPDWAGATTLPRGNSDMQFPDVDKLMPDQPIAFSVGLNAKFLHQLSDAMGADQGVRLDFLATADRKPDESEEDYQPFPTALRPILVSPLGRHGENEPRGLLMPVRIG